MNAPQARLGQTEFVALLAVLFATVAISIDAMLPALPDIARELTPDAPNTAQLIITSFVFGMGLGTLLVGPLSDRFGRKPVILCGAALFITGALASWAAPTLHSLLAARIVMGLGAAAPRIVSLALVRDLYSGREMARIVSFAMMVFTLIPAVAPLMGSFVIAGFGWRAIFLVFVLFSVLSMTWLMLRQPETLPPVKRRPLQASSLYTAMVEVLSRRVILTAIAVQALLFGALFGTLSSTQQIFDATFGRAESFPLWFALIAVVAGSASLLNASLVLRLGMRWLITVTLGAQIALSALLAILYGASLLPEALMFPAYILWMIGVFSMAGLTLGNLNALALEPVGHIAGLAASVAGFVSTVSGAALAVPIGLSFNGTPLPLILAVLVIAVLGLLLMRSMPRA